MWKRSSLGVPILVLAALSLTLPACGSGGGGDGEPDAPPGGGQPDDVLQAAID